MKSIEITVFPRIHITLIAMNPNGIRINGGVGFAIQNPALHLKALPADEFEINDKGYIPMVQSEIQRLKSVIDNVCIQKGFKKNISITLERDAPPHSGFGTGTSIRLACLEALFLLNVESYTPETLISLSGRGGTSGIGIYTYFYGGFIMDIGHRNNSTELLPSNQVEGKRKPATMLTNLQMPNWDIGICIPVLLKPLSQGEEKEFFERNAQLTDTEVNEILYHSIFGVCGSVKEEDKELFEESIKKIQSTEWKKAEREAFKDNISDIEKILYASGATSVGMSSLGPCLYFTGDDISSVIIKAKERLAKGSCTFLQTKPDNQGRIVKKCLN
jgi:beta-ribofuranosylaminobenzene 5'-phosphate synthase